MAPADGLLAWRSGNGWLEGLGPRRADEVDPARQGFGVVHVSQHHDPGIRRGRERNTELTGRALVDAGRSMAVVGRGDLIGLRMKGAARLGDRNGIRYPSTRPAPQGQQNNHQDHQKASHVRIIRRCAPDVCSRTPAPSLDKSMSNPASCLAVASRAFPAFVRQLPTRQTATIRPALQAASYQEKPAFSPQFNPSTRRSRHPKRKIDPPRNKP